MKLSTADFVTFSTLTAYWDQSQAVKREKKVKHEMSNGTTLVVPELPLNNNERQRPSSAIPQSVEEVDIKELREMIDSQAAKLQELQERVKKKGSRPQTAPAVLLSSKTKVKLPPALVDDDQIATNVKHPTEEEPVTAPSTPSPTETY